MVGILGDVLAEAGERVKSSGPASLHLRGHV
jgi:hypothetical protein